MNYKILLSVMAFVLVSLGSRSQCSLQGNIIDGDDGTPVIGAIIYFPDLKKGATSDNTGKYRIDNLPKGKYLAEIKQIGYSSISFFVNACDSPIKNFVLPTTVVETKEVLVTGASKATELLKMPGAVATIDHAALFKTASTNIIDAITTKPGITQITSGAGISKPVIRGLGYNRIITLNDGIRQEGQQWGDEHGIEIDEYSAGKIEILKGPASLMYGSDAMAGVINILSTPPLTEGKIGGSITGNYQSNNKLSAVSFMQNGNIKDISWLLRGTYKLAGNYRNSADGLVFNSAFKELNWNGNIGLNKKWGYTHFIFSNFSQEPGLIEGSRDSLSGKFVKEVKLNDSTSYTEMASNEDLHSYSQFVPFQQITHRKLALDNSFLLGKSRLTALLAYQHNQRKEFGDIFNPNEPGLYFSLKSYTLDIKYFLPEKNNLQVTFGANGMMQENKNLGVEFLIPAYKQYDLGFFGYFKKELSDKLNIAGGIRYDFRNFSSDILIEDSVERFKLVNTSFQNMSGSVGATYAFSKALVLKANIARGYRAPQAAELSSNGMHEGTFRYEIGNSGLKAETSIQSDLGLLYNSEHVTIDAAFFNNSIQNFVYLKKLIAVDGGDSISDPKEGAPSYLFTQGKALLNGGELSVDIHPHPFHWLHFENTFSFVNGLNKNQSDSSKYLPMMPPDRITSELRADIKKLNKYLVNGYALVNTQNYLAQNKVLLANATETTTPGYTLWNAAFGCELRNKKGNNAGNIVFAINNVFDKAYQSHLSRLKYAPVNNVTARIGVFNPGRNFSVKLQLPLNFKS